MLPGIYHTDKTIYRGRTPHLWTSQWHHTVNKTRSTCRQYVAGCLLPAETSNSCSHGTFWMGKAIMQRQVQNHLSCQKSGEEGSRRDPAHLPSRQQWWQLFGQAHSTRVPWAPCRHHHPRSRSRGASLQKSWEMQDAATLQPGARCCWGDVALTNSPWTEPCTERVLPPLPSPSLVFLNSPIVLQVHLEREKEQNVKAALRVLCITTASPSQGKRGVTHSFWVFGTII